MNTKEYIGSGILESYIMGATTIDESKQVEEILASYPEVRKEYDEISNAMESYAEAHAIEPNITMKPLLLATINYSERLKNGEAPEFPPILNENSKPSDYDRWLNRDDMALPEDFDSLYARIIGYSPQATTAIIWIKDVAPPEVHNAEFEKFLIIEGSCDITIEDEVHHLVPGDYLSIPLYKEHNVQITSDIPCKIILQRVAA
jgi:mannose-6-phosphate isomerase-like protein (cupin superfamily)